MAGLMPHHQGEARLVEMLATRVDQVMRALAAAPPGAMQPSPLPRPHRDHDACLGLCGCWAWAAGWPAWRRALAAPSASSWAALQGWQWHGSTSDDSKFRTIIFIMVVHSGINGNRMLVIRHPLAGRPLAGARSAAHGPWIRRGAPSPIMLPCPGRHGLVGAVFITIATATDAIHGARTVRP